MSTKRLGIRLRTRISVSVSSRQGLLEIVEVDSIVIQRNSVTLSMRVRGS